MKKKLSAIIGAAALVCVLAFVLIYTHSQTIEQRYPVLDLSKCIGIRGEYSFDGVEPSQSFFVSPDDAQFGEMIELFRQASFRTKITNILPESIKTHSGEGFRWEVIFKFDSVRMEDGSTVSGDLLRVSNFFGNLELFFDGKTVQCSVTDSADWLEAVLRTAEK